MRDHPVSRSMTDNLDRGVLDRPRFARSFRRRHRKVKDFAGEHFGAFLPSQDFVDRREHGAAHGWGFRAQELHHKLFADLAAPLAPADVTAIDTQGLVRRHEANVVVLVVDVLADLVVAGLIRTVETADKVHARVFGQGLAREIPLLSRGVRHGFQRDEGIIRLGSPGQFRKLVLLREFGRRRPCDAQGLSRNGVRQRVSDTPHFFVITAPAQDTERAVKTARQVVVPLAVVHELAVLLGLFVVQQAHGGAAPDLANAPAGVTVQHEGGGVEAGHGTYIARRGVDRFLALGRQRRGCGHREGEIAVLAVVDEADLCPPVAVRIAPASGVAVKVNQRAQQCVIGNIGAAFPGQQQERDHRRAARIQVSVAVGDRANSAPAGPGVEVLPLDRVIDPFLYAREHLLVAGAQVVFTQRNTAETEIPGVGVRAIGDAPRPFSHYLQILVLAGGQEEQHADAGDAFVRLGLGEIVGDLAHDLVRLGAVQRPGLAVRAEHGNLDYDRFSQALDGELESAVGGFSFAEYPGQLHARVDVGEFLTVDGLDDLPLLQLTGGFGGRAFLDILDLHHECGLMQFDPHTDRPEAIDGLHRLGLTRTGGEYRRALVKTLCSRLRFVRGAGVGTNQKYGYDCDTDLLFHDAVSLSPRRANERQRA